jgi:hypothetical protein
VEIRFDSVRETRRAVEALRAAGLIVMVDDDCRHRVIDLAAGHPTRGDLKGSGATDLGTEDPRVHTIQSRSRRRGCTRQLEGSI